MRASTKIKIKAVVLVSTVTVHKRAKDNVKKKQ